MPALPRAVFARVRCVATRYDRRAEVTWPFSAGSDFDPRSELHNAIGRDVEEVRDASGVARHRGKDSIAPQSQASSARRRHDFLARQEIGDVHRLELQALRAAKFERDSDVGLLHEAVSRCDAPAIMLQPVHSEFVV